MIGAIVSAYIGGEAVGAVLMSILGDKLGRKVRVLLPKE